MLLPLVVQSLAKLGGGTVNISGMAAPYVSGLVLLMQQMAEQELGRKLTPAEVRLIIDTQSNQNFDGDDEVILIKIQQTYTITKQV